MSESPTKSYSTTSSPEAKKPPILTKKGKAAAFIAGLAVTGFAVPVAQDVAIAGSNKIMDMMGIEPAQNPDKRKLIPIPKLTGDIDSMGTFQGTEDWNSVVKVKVKPGDSVSSIHLDVYGADDNNEAMNNEFYADEIAIIKSSLPDPEMLHPGDELVLPADVTQHYAITEETSN